MCMIQGDRSNAYELFHSSDICGVSNKIWSSESPIKGGHILCTHCSRNDQLGLWVDAQC